MRAHSQAIARSLGRHRHFHLSERLAAYWAADGEVDPAPLMALARQRHKRCFLPVLRPHPQRKLWFLPYSPGDPLTRNRFGIPEPDVRRRHVALAWELDIILVPLVAFDSECRRLGMGGGFFDRTLAYMRYRSAWRRPRLIGLAHECQRVDRLPTQPWDVPLDMVVTESRIYRRESWSGEGGGHS